MKSTHLYVLYCFLNGYLLTIVCEEDLYKRLGVERTATLREVKKAYKKLARELHPDKNREADAHDRFTAINEAYEILTDSEKRKEYDHFGTVNMPQHDRRQGFQSGFHPFHEFFGGFNFNFGGGEPSDKHRITYRAYKMTILPESYEKIYIIYTYESLCMTCMRIQPVWDRFTKDLEVIGVGIGAFNMDRDQQLASSIKVYHGPQIVGIVNGKVSYYRGDAHVVELRKFTRSLFPSKMVILVDQYNYESFLSGWKDNRVRALLFSNQEQIPLRLVGAAFKFKERIVTGYVKCSHATQSIESRLGLRPNRESLVMFNEDVSAPVAIASMTKLSRSTMDEVFDANKYLQLPRLSSQKIFNELCPIETRKSLRKLCVVLVTKNLMEHDVARATFTDVSKDSVRFRRNTQFAYIYEESQTDFLKSLSQQRKSVADTHLEIVILWRRGSRQMDYEWLENGWSSTSETVSTNKKKLVRTLNDILYNNLQMAASVGGWPELMDEHAQTLPVRIYNRILDWIDSIYMLYRGIDELTFLYAIFSVICIAFFGVFMHKLAVMEDESINGPRRPEKEQEPEKKKDDNTLLIRELRDETFPQLVRDSPPGHITICILIDKDRKTKLLQKFARICWTYSRYKAFTFSFLQLENHIDWYRRLLEETLDFKRNLDHINIKNCIGTVLAINGHRKYFCMYHAKHSAKRKQTRKTDDNYSTGGAGKFMGFDDDSSEDDDIRNLAIFEEDLLLGLQDWFDNLCEGSLRRMRVNKWPDTCIL